MVIERDPPQSNPIRKADRLDDPMADPQFKRVIRHFLENKTPAAKMGHKPHKGERMDKRIATDKKPIGRVSDGKLRDARRKKIQD